jgi:putative addiction module killer protein
MILKESNEFAKWMSKQNLETRIIIGARLLRVADGNFGDKKSVGGGVSELRIHNGGFRVYYTIRGREIVFLLCAGDKSSQKRDIKKAQEIAKEV